MRYSGDEGTLPAKPYQVALSMDPEYFRDKIVFVGGRPETQPLSAPADVFARPFTRWGGPLTAGMEIQATMFLNLWRHEWLTRMPAWAEALLLAISGAGLGYGLILMRPLRGLFASVALIGMAAAAGCSLQWYSGVWFSWLLVAGAQVPCAWACAAAWHIPRLARGQATLMEPKGDFATRLTAPAMAPTRGSDDRGPASGSAPGSSFASPGAPASRVLADHELLRRIGKGAYGEVYLARSAIGLYHAVKLVYRDNFREAGPYEREFNGIQKYMPVSLGHPGLVPLLHVGRNDEAGCFYYVMELGDDQSGGTQVDPATYTPKNLQVELKRRGCLPVSECVEMFLALAGALDYLHGAKLVHRDIKPSNIIFAKGLPKFTDIGLVTDLASTAQDVSYVGTEGYIPPEGPGTAAADVFSLGVVLYQAVTGLDQHRFPELPRTLTGRSDAEFLLRINRVMLRACQPDVQERYRSAAEMQADLLRLRSADTKAAAV